MPNDTASPSLMQQARKKIEENTGGAVGAGLVLVLLPSLALVFGLDKINKIPLAGLPLLAIFGIMILFGSLALTSTLFARLKLHNSREALGLPSGSVRATIALSLIVLFAIIAIMLHQSVAEPFEIKGLTEAEKNAVVRDLAQRVIGVRPHLCPAATPAPTASAPATAASPAAVPPAAAASAVPCASTYDVLVLPPRGQEATDLAKQLLILIGTLMTSVTSYYFAARTSEGSAPPETPKEEPATDATPPGPALAAASPDTHEGHLDGCSVAIADATPDHELPTAQGGVA